MIDPPPVSHKHDAESTRATDVVESAPEVNKNSDVYVREESTPVVGEEELTHSDQRVETASKYETSQKENLDISALTRAEVLISLAQAQAALTPEVLKVLEEKFKGSLSQIRHVDERDQIF